jgi:16S rRNA (guanine966-N2)-methyltransferase
VFDRIQGEVVGARVLDLFAGSGALAIEALSRGAKEATLVERARPLARHLVRQLERLGLQERARVEATQAERFVEGGRDSGGPFDLVFLDPPYADEDAYRRSLEGLMGGSFLAPEALVVCERARRAKLAAWPEFLREEAEKRHGDCVLHFLRVL